MKTYVARTPETSVNSCSEDGGSILRLNSEDFYYISRRHIPHDSNFHVQRVS
jgi:hypothetical protein